MHHAHRPARLLAGLVAAAGLTAAPAAHAAATVTALPDTSQAAAQALAAQLLAAGGGVNLVAGSAQYVGAASASGSFANGNAAAASGLGIDSGVVLTTGDARFIGSSAAFAGDDANKSGTYTAGVGNTLTANTSAGSTLFAPLSSAGSFNASILGFQIVPAYTTLTLSLVFASEDYNDVVNTGFPTDVFAVFVNGVNQALVPGSSLAISASSIHCGGPSSGPPNGNNPRNCALYRDNAPFSGAIDSELDGMTVRLTLQMGVLANQVNTIAIGVADTLDTAGDSAVLLQAGSMAAVPEPTGWMLMLGGLAAGASLRHRRRA